MKRASLYVGAALVLGLVLTALVAAVWTPHDPTRVVLASAFLPPSADYWAGTDSLGIDIASQLMVGARVCLTVGVVAVAIAAIVGVPLGMLAGMRGGWVSSLVMRVTDVLYAFPALLLAVILAAAIGGSTTVVMVSIGVATIPVFARIARAATLPVMASDYVLAARAAGTSTLAIAWRHVLRNIAPVLGVQVSVSFGIAILAEAGLSYLGVGVPLNTPTWGRMLFDARSHLHDHPLLTIWPAAAIASAVLGFNLLGDGLRDVLDPRLKEIR